MSLGLDTGQKTVTTGATLIVAARNGRKDVVIVNEGTTDVRIGGPNVTTANGVLLNGTKGAGVVLSTSGPVYGIVGTGTQAVSYAEVF